MLFALFAAYFYFSPDTKSPGPFHLNVTLQDKSRKLQLNSEDFRIKVKEPFEIKFPEAIDIYEIRLELDGHLAYANSYHKGDIPF